MYLRVQRSVSGHTVAAGRRTPELAPKAGAVFVAGSPPELVRVLGERFPRGAR